ncbi:hypothetical protein K443DRAFT_290493 [Laccaria amethystina LaAM-08-1]|uniref:Hydrophobin n=1 Tax=Laccaria amethystina LaAM-08-1 TaxID=1095629 RepID=A0A0C9YDM0_9AGAR|nr:hypothetical protein K443DRAFT_290493 [Laccaria amethystina LaAM-08-1]
MKFTIVFTILAAPFFAAVSAAPSLTNAKRLARGWSPNPPARRVTPVAAARRSQPSGIYGSCNTGTMHCCNSVTSSNSQIAGTFAGLLDIVLPHNTAVGITCSPLSAAGLGHGGTCTQQPVCCTGNNYSGLVVVGCSPININLI